LAARAFCLLDIDRFLREAGADRVGEDASKKLCQMLEDSAEEIVAKAKILARYAGRNEITSDDIRLAASMLYAL